ncbi:MAG: hypothetical protein KA248_14805 [Kiritimatiellae bacterium]|nr:hypothetical protein [Kiritimatiellia bacterium]
MTQGSDNRAVERLTALWALNEAGLGGLIHALKVPFTGIVVGSTAVVLIALIAHFSERKAAALLKATVIVLLVKAAASPHTPMPAYAAVAFQGLAGALLFGYLPAPRLAAMILGLLALWQGAVQKLVVMTLLYGAPLWDSVDAVGRWIIGKLGGGPGALSPTGWVLTLYLGYYTLGGLVTGGLAGAIPREIDRALKEVPPPEPAAPAAPDLSAGPAAKPWWHRTPFRAGLVLVALLISVTLISPGGGGLARGMNVLLRAALVIVIWMLAVRPIVRWGLARFQKREQGLYGADVARTMNQLPGLRRAAAAAWAQSGDRRGLRRWKRFLVQLVVRALANDN